MTTPVKGKRSLTLLSNENLRSDEMYSGRNPSPPRTREILAPVINQSVDQRRSKGLELSLCPLCVVKTEVKTCFLSDHLTLEHDYQMFKCNMCNEDIDVPHDGLFESYQEVRQHLNSEHCITNINKIKEKIIYPSLSLLQSFKCNLCDRDKIVGVSEVEFVKIHIGKWHNAKKIEPSDYFKECRLCLQDLNPGLKMEKHFEDAHSDLLDLTNIQDDPLAIEVETQKSKEIRAPPSPKKPKSVTNTLTPSAYRKKADLADLFCEACQMLFSQLRAKSHFEGRLHQENVSNKVRCFQCSKYLRPGVLGRHVFDKHFNNTFRCMLGLECKDIWFRDTVKLNAHMKKNHPLEFGKNSLENLVKNGHVRLPDSLSNFTCKLCNKYFTFDSIEKVVREHKWEHSDITLDNTDFSFFCRICGLNFKFQSSESLKEHIRSSHSYKTRSSPKNWSKECIEKSDREKEFTDYKQDEEPKMFVCKVCRPRRSFQTKEAYDQHKLHHNKMESSNRICQLCDPVKTFDSHLSLEQHLMMKHRNKKNKIEFKCLKCDAFFDSQNDLEKHKLYRHEPESKDLFCTKCVPIKFFDSQLALQQHQLDSHKKCSPPSDTLTATVKLVSKEKMENKNDGNEVCSIPCDCYYCLEEQENEVKKLIHISKKHQNESFRCLLCAEMSSALFSNGLAVLEHLRLEHAMDCENVAGIEDGAVMIPEKLSCVHCYFCSKDFFCLGVEEMREHFKSRHSTSKFDEAHFDYKCRICMESGVYDDFQELRAHFFASHKKV